MHGRPRRARLAGPVAGLLAGLLVALLTPAAAAHRLKEALTTVEVNGNTELVEVVHRFWLHDAEHAVANLAGLTGDLRGDAGLQAAFARYVAGRFVLADADGRPLELTLLGAELDGPYLWVYQEMPAERFADIAFVAHGTLQDVWSDQLNQVNLLRASGVRSLYLRAGDALVAVPAAADDGTS